MWNINKHTWKLLWKRQSFENAHGIAEVGQIITTENDLESNDRKLRESGLDFRGNLYLCATV